MARRIKTKRVSKTTTGKRVSSRKIVVANVYRKQDDSGATNKDHVLSAWLAGHGVVDAVRMADQLPGLCKAHTSKRTGKMETPTEARERAERTIRAWVSAFRRGGATVGYPRSARDSKRNAQIVAVLKKIGADSSAIADAKQIASADYRLQFPYDC